MKPGLRNTQFITDNKTNTLLGVCLGWGLLLWIKNKGPIVKNR